ncbi:unnamed protein product [Rotaria magnacalcarata]|nr:unnamed protein product [Rotaria magnacalcarata]
MTSALQQKTCPVCQNGVATCNGCQKRFCIPHFTEHRQELDRRMDEVVHKHNQLLEAFNLQGNAHHLQSQINEWEKKSIEKIKIAAEEARADLQTFTNRRKHQIKNLLDNMTEQLKSSQAAAIHTEKELDEWMHKLMELRQMLERPQNIEVVEDEAARSFICLIKVIEKPNIGRYPTINPTEVEARPQIQTIATVLPIHSVNIPLSAKWLQNGVTVAGGNGQGSGLNQLSYPYSLSVDDDDTIYITDLRNQRVVEWKCGAKTGHVVAGGNGRGRRNDQLDCPTDVILDKKNDSLIICDSGNKRVVRWPRQNGVCGETIIPSISCERLTMDDEGFLYISCPTENVVRKWQVDDNSLKTVAGGNGRGDRLDQLNWPTFIFVDRDHSLYVSEWNNNRVMKWMKDAKEGTVITGGHKYGTYMAPLSGPAGLLVDQLGTIYVADHRNNRVICWSKGKKTPSIVVGGNGHGEQGSQLDGPEGLSFNRRGDLYVVDRGNCRVQRFSIEGCT